MDGLLLYFLYFIVNGLEEEWGEFRTTLYVLVAVLFTIAFSFAFSVRIYNIVELEIDAFPGGRHHRAGIPDPLVLRASGEDEMAGVVDGRVYRLFPDRSVPWLSRLYLLTMYANYLLFLGPYFAGRIKAFYRRKKFQQDVAAGRVR